MTSLSSGAKMIEDDDITSFTVSGRGVLYGWLVPSFVPIIFKAAGYVPLLGWAIVLMPLWIPVVAATQYLLAVLASEFIKDFEGNTDDD